MGPREKGTAPHPIFGPYLSWPNGWMDQDAMPLGTEVNLGAGDVVLDGVAAPPLKGHSTPFFGPCLLWPNGWIDEDATSYGSRPRLRPCCVRRGPSSPQKKSTAPTQFLAHVYCGQMAGSMKTPVGAEVDLSPGHIVLDGVPALREWAQQPPSFPPVSIVAAVTHLSYC